MRQKKNEKKQNSNENRLFAENDELPQFNDPMCDEAVSYSAWSQCQPNCKQTANQMGERTRTLVFKTPKARKECAVRVILKYSHYFLSIHM